MSPGGGAAPPGWPSHNQELLLRAVLADTGSATRAWGEVRGDLDYENLDLDSLWLVALASRRVGGLGDLSGRVAGWTRRTWYVNRLLLQAVEESIGALDQRGLRCVVLDELALLVGSYGDLSARSIWSAALWVRAPDAEPLWEALSSTGWTRAAEAVDLLYAPAQRIHLVHRDGHRCWVLRERDVPARERDALDDAWSRAAAADTGALAGDASGGTDLTSVTTLDPADQLVRSCVDGLRWQGRPAVAWAADVTTLMRAHPELDWERVMSRCEVWAVALPTATALTYVARVCGVATPPDVMAALRARAARRGEALAYRVTGRQRPNPDNVPVAVAGTLRRLRGGVGRHEVRRFLAALWAVEHTWQLPAVAAGKTWRRLRARGAPARPGAVSVGPGLAGGPRRP